MSRVQPPGRFAAFGRRPFGAKTPGCGQVSALAGRMLSMLNSAFVNALEGAVAGGSVQVAASGGDVKFTSSCFRHVNGAPAWSICLTWAVVAFARPFTPSQPP